MGLYDVTMAFINAYLSDKKAVSRRQQYMDLCERLGKKMGARGFQLNEQFHHVIWMGDLNYKCHTINAEQAMSLITEGRHRYMRARFDELSQEMRGMYIHTRTQVCVMQRTVCFVSAAFDSPPTPSLTLSDRQVFFMYKEPTMANNFIPTYRKHASRPVLELTDPDWARKVYNTEFKEPFYKGGWMVERVPAWTDRILYHSLTSREGELRPEAQDPDDEDSPHNYMPVNAGLDHSEHSPVACTFVLEIDADDIPTAAGNALEEEEAAAKAEAKAAEGRSGADGKITKLVAQPLVPGWDEPCNVVITVRDVTVCMGGPTCGKQIVCSSCVCVCICVLFLSCSCLGRSSSEAKCALRAPSTFSFPCPLRTLMPSPSAPSLLVQATLPSLAPTCRPPSLRPPRPWCHACRVCLASTCCSRCRWTTTPRPSASFACGNAA